MPGWRRYREKGQSPQLSPPLVPKSPTSPRLLLPPVLSEVLVPQGQQDEVTLAGSS